MLSKLTSPIFVFLAQTRSITQTQKISSGFYWSQVVFFQLDIIKKWQAFIWLCLLNFFFFSLQPIYKLILFWIIINCWRPVINLFILQDKPHLTALKHGRGIFSGTVSRRNFQCMGGTKLLRRHNSHLILCKPYFHKLPPAMKRFFLF